MAEHGRTVARFASGALLLGLLVGIAHTRLSDPREGAALRIAVRTMASTAVTCRTLDDAELAALPAHMRRPRTCETRAIPYRLEVAVDGVPRLDRWYRAAGLHGDRPMTIDETLEVPPGRHRLVIRLAPRDPAGNGDHPAFELDETVELEEGQIGIAALEGTSQQFTFQ